MKLRVITNIEDIIRAEDMIMAGGDTLLHPIPDKMYAWVTANFSRDYWHEIYLYWREIQERHGQTWDCLWVSDRQGNSTCLKFTKELWEYLESDRKGSPPL